MAVEGNKNAALPLLAACLLTDDECVLTNVPRIGDVEVMARLLLDLGAEVDGIGTHDAARPRAAVRNARAGSARWSAGCAGRCCCSGRCWRARAARTSRRPAATSRRGASISTHLEALVAMGARAAAGPDHVLEAPDGLKGASMYLYEASVTGTETALLAAAARDGRHRDPPRRHRAARRRALRVPGEDGRRRHRASAARSIRVEGVARLHGAEHRLGGDYIEAGSWAVVGAITGGEIDIEGAREEDIEVVAAVLKRMNVECGMRDGVFQVKPSKPKAVRPDHDRPVAGVPERPRSAS